MSRCPHCGRTEVLWTREAIIEALRTWHAQHGTAPSAQEWLSAGRGHPSNHTVREMFGTLATARTAAGTPFRRKNDTGWTRDTAVQAIFEWAFLHGGPPTQRDWTTAPAGFPSTSVVRRLFGGTWNAALVAAGYEPRRPRRTSRGYSLAAAAAGRVRSADGAFAGAEA